MFLEIRILFRETFYFSMNQFSMNQRRIFMKHKGRGYRRKLAEAFSTIYEKSCHGLCNFIPITAVIASFRALQKEFFQKSSLIGGDRRSDAGCVIPILTFPSLLTELSRI